MILSKTNYILWRECPKNAWYKIHEPDIYYETELSEFEKSIMETGNEVEKVARKLFPDGILIEDRGEEAQKLTLELIGKGKKVLFQAEFEKNNFTAALDILELKDDGSCDVFEVKATNEIDTTCHYHDLAFQVVLLQKYGFKIKSANLIHLNREYVRQGELDISQLFKIENVTEKITEMAPEIEAQMQSALKYLNQEKEPEGFCTCVHKGRSAHCSTFKHANPSVPDYSVHDLARIGSSKQKLEELISNNIFLLDDIPDEMQFTEKQKNQIMVHKTNTVLIDKLKIAYELGGLQWPLYFLDYETFPCAIPRFDGFSPFQHIPFQYSLHVLDSPSAELRHFEFLYEKPSDPSQSFVDSMKSQIGAVGNIIVWNKNFEGTINKTIGARLPEEKAFLENINARFYDLEDIFKNQHYVDKNFRGRTSIKKVLPVLVPELSYNDLEIREGGMASQSWDKIHPVKSADKVGGAPPLAGQFNRVNPEITEDERQKIIKNLKKYCERDTFAMYAIWKYLNDLLAQKQ